MYEISIDGVVLQTTQYPNWIYYRADLQSWCVTDEAHAEAILIPTDTETEREEIYANIDGKPIASETFPTAVVRVIN